ncbi:MAG: S8 family serine peptidase [Thermoanaerobaculia bacterium]|nr:S8 family serine peptidase [Thermoanaerobaculia bacterium]
MRRAEAALATVVALLLLASGCAAGLTTPPAAPQATLETTAAERQILVVPSSSHPAVVEGLARDLVAFAGLDLLASWEMVSLGAPCFVLAAPAAADREKLVRRLRQDRRVALAQPVELHRTLGAPWNDTYAPLQTSLEPLGLAAAHAWATGAGVRVAVVDTGVDLSHPDLEGRVVLARSFAPSGHPSFTEDIHGTAVAGVMAARAGNGIGIVGVAPGAELIALKACWPERPGDRQAVCDSYSLARALDFALSQVPRILNLSLGGPPDPLLSRFLARAEELGILAVAAADSSAPFPASLPTVLGISGPSPPVAAAARLAATSDELLTTGPRGGYDFFSGSSFAAAQASGVAALLLEARPSLSPAELRSLLVAGARRAGTADVLPLLHACGALAAALGADACAAPPGPR